MLGKRKNIVKFKIELNNFDGEIGINSMDVGDERDAAENKEEDTAELSNRR